VIVLAFDPLLRLGDTTVKLETLGIAVAALVALLLAGWLATRTPAPASPVAVVSGVAEPRDLHLRIDDMFFIVLAILPGAVIGGRLGYTLVHFDFYRTHLAAAIDPGQGSLELSFAVIGGTLTGAYACYLLGESVGRWLHVATVPTFAAIALGKVAQALGGSGQGQPANLTWATSYQGDGPWGSLAPAVPAHPAQLYEAAATFLVLVLVARLLGSTAFEHRDGRSFVVALLLWLLARAAVATAWRDGTVMGPMNAAQVLCLTSAAISLLVLVALTIRARRVARAESRPNWPDPEARPQF
jgi:prolipoprotein diacylglyceryltransferase